MSSPFPLTGSPSRCMENVESFWLADNQSRHFCRKRENVKTGQKIFQHVVPLALVQKILHSLHSDYTSAHLGVTKTLEKVCSHFYWPGYKRVVEVFVASCFVCQKRNSPTKKPIHRLRIWKPSFPFSTVLIFWTHFRFLPEVNIPYWSVIISPSGMKRWRYQISQLWRQLKPSWIMGSAALAAPTAFIPTKDVILKLNFSQV